MQKTKVGGRGKPRSLVKLETVKGRKSAKERATAGEKKVVLVNAMSKNTGMRWSLRETEAALGVLAKDDSRASLPSV